MSQGTPISGGVNRPQLARWPLLAVIMWGCVLAAWLARVWFQLPVDRVHVNHEQHQYAARLIEFRDLLGAGYLSPQWASHFRGGLGSPYFSYYQPGFFYAASLVPWNVAPNHALGVTVMAFSLVGYLGMFILVRNRFGVLSGVLAATLLLLSVYPATEIFVRGDLAEFSSMMLVPLALAALDNWMRIGHLRHVAILAATCAAIIVTHAAVGLVTHGLIGLLLLALTIAPQTRRRALGAIVGIGTGVAMAAFYWLPVFLEWQFVTPDAAFQGFFHYSSHFYGPKALVSPYTRSTLVPLTLGWVVPWVLLVNAGSALVGRGFTKSQRAVFLIGLGGLFASVFLMTRASEPVWAAFKPLQRLQFPWRILTLVSVLSAALAGAMPRWPSERWRAAACAAIVMVALFNSWTTYTAYELDPTLKVPTDVESLARFFFAPDLANEWMPKGASLKATDVAKRLPTAGAGGEVSGYELGAGRLQVHVRTTSPTFVTLPHYFFPVGWIAEFNGQRMRLGVDEFGLMQVELPAAADGVLELRFTMTPMRRLGCLISGGTFALGVILLVFLAGARRRTALSQEDPARAPN